MTCEPTKKYKMILRNTGSRFISATIERWNGNSYRPWATVGGVTEDEAREMAADLKADVE